MLKPKFQLIQIDCPWEYSRDLGKNPKNGGITYDTLSTEDLSKLSLSEIADKDCALFVWATFPKLLEACSVIKSWGFKYITCGFTWLKINPTGEVIYYRDNPSRVITEKDLVKIKDADGKVDYNELLKMSIRLDGKDLTIKKGIYSGMGFWTNGNAEICLFAKRGALKRVKTTVKQIVIAPRGDHSVKPPEVTNRMVEMIGDVPRIEIFGRKLSEGWLVIGNDVCDGEDIRVSLKRLRDERNHDLGDTVNVSTEGGLIAGYIVVGKKGRYGVLHKMDGRCEVYWGQESKENVAVVLMEKRNKGFKNK